MMRTALQRMLAIVVMAMLAGLGVAVMATWSPTTAGLISPASAQEDDDGDEDDGDDDDGGGEAPVRGVATGLGGTASPTGDDDDDDDGGDGGAEVPVGGVATGLGGTASPTGDDDDDDDGGDDGAEVPVGGVATGMGGTAQSWTAEPAGNDRSAGTSMIGWAAPLAGLAVGGATVGRLAIARLGGRRD
jgi:hypothetical protein